MTPSRIAVQYRSAFTGDWWTVRMVAPIIDDDGRCSEDDRTFRRRAASERDYHAKRNPTVEWRATP